MSLVAHWKLDEASGTGITDSAGSNTGTWAGTGAQALSSVVAPNKTGLLFDGVDDGLWHRFIRQHIKLPVADTQAQAEMLLDRLEIAI